MRRFVVLCLALAVTANLHAQQKWAPSPHIAATEALPPEQQRLKFHLPPGFEIELVAAEPAIRKPINIAFDSAGRLWVTETIEYPFAAPEGKGRDGVKILSDFAPNGLARKVTAFASDLNIPIGVLPTGREALVFSIPSIWSMSDTTGSGKADRRKVLYSGYGHKDTHGMTGEFMWGFDGWVYCCHGYSNTSNVKSQGKDAITMQSGNTYRIKRDGSRIEYFTHGQVNPFGLAFDPLGNLYSTDCHTRPLYQLLKGAWYPSFGKPHDGLGFGPEMVTHDHGSTAIAGIAYYADDKFPPEFRDNLFVGNVVTNRINRDRLERHGSTYKGIAMPDFVRCDDPWFRPVDIKLGPDGALYVADFYNRIIGHYEVALDHPGRDRDKGRIWRIVYKRGGAKPRGERSELLGPNLATASPADLIKHLASPNLTVRLQATHELVERIGADAAPLAQKALSSGSAFQRAHALWVLQRLGKLDDDTLKRAARDPDALVRTHTHRVLGERPQLGKLKADAVVALKDADAFVRRAAAEAVGAHRSADYIRPLLDLRARVPADDTHLLHVVRMALRDHLRDSFASAAELSDADWHYLADICPGVHTEAASQFLMEYLERFRVQPERFEPRYIHALVRYGGVNADGAALPLIVDLFKNDLPGQATLLKTIQQAKQERSEAPNHFVRMQADTVTGQLLASKQDRDLLAGMELAAAFKSKAAAPRLLDLVREEKLSLALRKQAVQTLLAMNAAKQVQELTALMLDEKGAVALREQVASALATLNRPDSDAVLIKALQRAPGRLQQTIALGLASSKPGGERLLDAIEKGAASRRLLRDPAIEQRLRQAKIPRGEERLKKLTQGLPAEDERLHALLAQRRDGFRGVPADAGLGKKVFEKSCAACHTIANQGSKIGPQLDGIGIRGLDRVLEDVLDPSRNVDQAFRSTLLTLENGQLVSGLVLREEGAVVILADAQGKEQRVPKSSIQEREVSPLSPMPSNFAEQITEPDFYHLLAYLLEQRAKE